MFQKQWRWTCLCRRGLLTSRAAHCMVNGSPVTPRLLRSKTSTRFFSLFPLKLNPPVAFGNEQRLSWGVPEEALVPKSGATLPTADMLSMTGDRESRWAGSCRVGTRVPVCRQELQTTGSDAWLHLLRLRRVQSRTGTQDKQLCHCSVFRKG